MHDNVLIPIIIKYHVQLMHKKGLETKLKRFVLLLCKSIRPYKEIKTAIIGL